jgi:hypothetical protein
MKHTDNVHLFLFFVRSLTDAIINTKGLQQTDWSRMHMHAHWDHLIGLVLFSAGWLENTKPRFTGFNSRTHHSRHQVLSFSQLLNETDGNTQIL